MALPKFTAALAGAACLFTGRPTLAVRHGASVATDAVEANLDGDYFVFLEVYPLEGTDAAGVFGMVKDALWGNDVAGLVELGDAANATSGSLFHSEVTICPRQQFSQGDQEFLAKKLQGESLQSFTEVPVDWWQGRSNVQCRTLAYGGGGEDEPSEESCSGVRQLDKLLSESRAAIANADVTQVWKYFYGATTMDADTARSTVCQDSCGEDWSQKKYYAPLRNCNFFSSTLLKCVLDLSGSTPWLGVSKLRQVITCPSCQ